jgi:uroporphyrinogen-III decarboxylase
MIKSIDEYLRLKQHLYPQDGFDRATMAAWSAIHKNGDMAIWFWVEGFFWFPRRLLGIEQHLYTFYDNPDLMHMINKDIMQYNLRVIKDICQYCKPSFVLFGEDLSYNHGPMLSKKCFDEFLSPYYREIIPEIKKLGIVPFIDSDGDVATCIPWFREVGIEGIGPLERMAGVDVVQIRKDHPNFRLIGGFDKTIMHLGEDAMRKEFERLLPVMKQGGYLLSVDHQTPPEVSLDDYRLYLSLLKEYGEKAAR